jgi:hypothetical protein
MGEEIFSETNITLIVRLEFESGIYLRTMNAILDALRGRNLTFPTNDSMEFTMMYSLELAKFLVLVDAALEGNYAMVFTQLEDNKNAMRILVVEV